jgi:hypothetical protein
VHKPVVDENDPVVRPDQEIIRLEVEMDDAVLMKRTESVGLWMMSIA